MILLSKKPISSILLAVGLTSVSNCAANTPVNAPVVQANAIAQRLVQQAAPKPNNPQFGQPIDCTLGKDCFVMLYFDRDPGPAAVDFGCGRQTYNGHDGTDFAIPDEKIMAQGVPVIASAAGKVLRARDGVADRRLQTSTDKANIEGIECGNGMVIDHGNGWEAQYCHLRKGSLVVKPGMQVAKGTKLGLVGTSGMTSFPHVHVTFRYQGKAVDPFVGTDAKSGCNTARNPIWDKPIDYISTGLIRAGFAPKPPDIEAVWQGQFSETKLPANSPALLFWVQSYGVLAGDREHYKLFDPNGQIVADRANEIKAPSRTWLGYLGKRNNPNSPLTSGVWRAEYRLTRGDRVLTNITREVELR
ncbi:MAG: M23 family metallopeptidase [Oscillatoriaceae cyanobacterium Prado104]|jgi:murein DD-endopeptidase MepM/ murein hydrolase activator NlpD|nr:M23 family metallopeptidase [Oscillatoriaceae cyanobacterium Prado104]